MAGRSTRISVALIVAVASLAGFSAVALAATIVGTNGNDNLTGTPSHDLIVAKAGGDHVNALAGNDRVLAGAGDDTVNGGFGHDRIDDGRRDRSLDRPMKTNPGPPIVPPL